MSGPGLVHSYYIAQDSAIKLSAGNGHGERCGVEIVEPGGKVVFIVEKYFADFKAACAQYFQELVERRNRESLDHFREVVGGKWFATEHMGLV